jgi:serine/threonine protein kinase
MGSGSSATDVRARLSVQTSKVRPLPTIHQCSSRTTMGNPHVQPANRGPLPDLVGALRGSQILLPGQCRQIQAAIENGRYPRDPVELATVLVKQRLVTQYQARCLLHGSQSKLVFDRYVILDQLGKGAMGCIYKARHRLMGRIVAIKFISRKFVTRDCAIPRFFREMRLVGRLDHPSIVRALDAGQLDGSPFIVMEYVPGLTLDRLLERSGPLPPGELVRVAEHVALGLAHIHAQGIVHRDIKPSNLILGRDGRVRILDLGLGALVERDQQEGSFATSAGLAVGTIDYMSPEQAQGRSLDGASDLYSLGCTMYHLITGQLPFPGDSNIERLARRLKESPRPISAAHPDIPHSLTEIIERLMAIRPADRYADGEDVATALRRVAGSDPAVSDRSLGIGGEGTTSELVSIAPPKAESTRSSSLSGTAASSDHAFSADQLGLWFRFLYHLAEWPAASVLAVIVAILLAVFAAGFLLAHKFS